MIAVYAIAKNEGKLIRRWCECVQEADVVVLLDTGSTDDTLRQASEFPWPATCRVTIAEQCFTPWSFADARNAALALVPGEADFALAMDIDEVLEAGWADAFRTAITDDVASLRYKFVSDHAPDGTPAVTFYRNWCHRRHGYEWRHPIHEALYATTAVGREATVDGVLMHHYPLPGRAARPWYLEGLQRARNADPTDTRMSFYLGREYYFQRQYDDARAELIRRADMQGYYAERAEAMRLLAQIAVDVKQDWTTATYWLQRAVKTDPRRRDHWVDLADAYHRRGMWQECLQAALVALQLTDRFNTFMTFPKAWSYLPHDLAALAAYQLGMADVAVRHNTDALALAPADVRLQTNHRFYEEAAHASGT